MEKFLTKGFEGFANNVTCDNNMRYFRVRLVYFTSVEGFKSHQSQELIGLHGDEYNHCVNN